ncbi:hypothetical protein X737_31755 [Mesorhizobium sp. L48C026A00]|nr:hypothetical protein X737_31755 [Mesorhizobium sp. L48C026A00]
MGRFRELEPKSFSAYHVEAPIRLDLAARIAFPDGSMGSKVFEKSATPVALPQK